MSKTGVLAVVSGFSGAGKGTLMNRLIEKYDNYALSISATTRKPREGEKEGVSYFFRTKEAFEKLIAEDALLEYAQYVGNYYGTPKAYVECQLEAGKDVILEIEIQGAMKIKEKVPGAVLLFVAPPSIEELKKRLTGRGTESADMIEARLRRAAEEAQGMEQYEYLLINDDLETCVDEMHQVIQSRHLDMNHNAAFAAQLKKEVEEFQKGE